MDRRRIPLQISDRLLGVRASDGRRVTGVELRNLYRECIRIAWPSTVEGVLMSVIGSMDTMMVGTLGPAAIAAVGLTGQPRMILLVLAQALCVGTTALCARRKGADNHAGAVQCLMQSLCFVTVLGVLITLLGTIGARPLMVIAGANEDTMEMSVAYFRIMSLGLLFTCWSLCICAAMRGIGQTRITLVTNMTANLVNVCLNYLLINGHFGFPAMGVRGAALATSISAAVGCAVAVSFLLRKNSYFRFTLPRFDRATLSGLYQIGSSSILETVCLRAGFLIMARLIAGTGTSSFAAYQIVQQVTSLSFVLGDGVATAGTSLVGQSLGAEREDLAQVHVAIVRRIGVFVSAGLMILIFLLRRQLAQLFTTDEEIITCSIHILPCGNHRNGTPEQPCYLFRLSARRRRRQIRRSLCSAQRDHTPAGSHLSELLSSQPCFPRDVFLRSRPLDRLCGRRLSPQLSSGQAYPPGKMDENPSLLSFSAERHSRYR